MRRVRRLHPSELLGDLLPQHDVRTFAFVSVVVPVRNEENNIQGTLEMLLDQDYPRDAYEILVVDGESDDRTRAIVSRIARAHNMVRLVDNPRRWSSSGRNIGVRRSRGDIIVIVDGHCELNSRQHLRHLVEAFERSGADVVGRPQPLKVANASDFQQAIGAARASRLGHHPDSYIYTHEDRFVPAISVGAAYRREVFDRIGFFDESFDACEDVDFNYRADQAGLTCFLSSRSAVHYEPRKTFAGLFYQLARYGRGRIRLWRKHPTTVSWKTLAPALFVAGLLGGAVAATIDPRWLYPYLAGLAIYATIVVLESFRIAAQQRRWRLVVWLPLVFATIHISAGLGILQETVVGAVAKWFSGRTTS